jgi:hypothetical protein
MGVDGYCIACRLGLPKPNLGYHHEHVSSTTAASGLSYVVVICGTTMVYYVRMCWWLLCPCIELNPVATVSLCSQAGTYVKIMDSNHAGLGCQADAAVL